MIISKTRRLTTVVTVAITAATALLVAAAPASAVSGLTIVSAVTSSSSAAAKSISVACPAGKRVIGGGGIVDDADPDSKAFVTAMVPVSIASGDRFDVAAMQPDDGYTGGWWLRSFAVCAKPSRGLQIIAATNTASSTTSQQHTVACPQGKRLLGAGGRVNNPAGQVALRAVRTDLAVGAKATINGHEDADGYRGTWSLTSYAVCVNPVPGLSIVTGTSAWDATTQKHATATCAAGHSTHSALYAITGGTGDAAIRVLHPSANSVTAAARELAGNSLNWSVTAIAVCAS